MISQAPLLAGQSESTDWSSWGPGDKKGLDVKPLILGMDPLESIYPFLFNGWFWREAKSKTFLTIEISSSSLCFSSKFRSIFFYANVYFLEQEGASSLTGDGCGVFVLSREIFSNETSEKETLLLLLRGPLYSTPYLTHEKCFQLSACLYYLQ